VRLSPGGLDSHRALDVPEYATGLGTHRLIAVCPR